MKVDVGSLIAGKYELVRVLGKGAMGEVWLARHDTLGGEFAIKLVEPADDMEAETASGRFQLEAHIAAKLSRKTRHIVSVSDHGEEDGLAYLVMELLEGESLEARIKSKVRLEPAEVTAIVQQVARALSLAHEEGIFHRDLKPANVWLARDEDGRLLVKLLDFGIARSKKPFRTRSPFATSKDMVLGTPSYMSPEQARGLDTLDHRCDLWALAVVAYEALTGQIPFDGATLEDVFLAICTFRVVPIRTRRPDLPASVDAFFARAFAPDIDQRFPSALELSDSFEPLWAPRAAAVDPSPASSSPDLVAPSRPGIVAHRGGPHPGLLGMVAVAASIVVIGVMVIALKKAASASARPPDARSTTASAVAPTMPSASPIAAPPPPEPRDVAPAPTPGTEPAGAKSAAPTARPAARPASASSPATLPTTSRPSLAAPPAPARSVEKSSVF